MNDQEIEKKQKDLDESIRVDMAEIQIEAANIIQM